MEPTVRTLALAAEDGAHLFPHWKWEVLATGHQLNTVGVLMGCDIVRVGFEDNTSAERTAREGKLPARQDHGLKSRKSSEGNRRPSAKGRQVFNIGNA